MKKPLNIIFGFFLVFGLVFALVPNLMVKYFIEKDYTIKATGVIKELKEHRTADDIEYDVIVTYEINEDVYTSELNFYSSDFFEGKKVDILVKNDDYTKITSPVVSELFLVIFGGIGITVVSISIVGLIVVNRYYRKYEDVRRTGSTIVASYIETKENTMVQVNGKHPYNIYCTWTNPQDNKTYIFKSESLWKDPTQAIEGRHIDTFRVFINPNNPNIYSIDIDNIKTVL